MNRYIRQQTFPGIGEDGQKRIEASRVAVAGCGALGTVIANTLARAGVGFIRIIDRDYVELSNLQRQTLFNEADAKEEMPKAVAAAGYLSQVNSEITLEPVVADINSSNINGLIEDVDLIVDGSDNFEIRTLLNEACCALQKKWIYGGVLGGEGMSMNILPDGPCFYCVGGEAPAPGSYPTCSTAGVISPITNLIASIQCAEALKILSGSDKVRKNLVAVDIWDNTMDFIDIIKRPDCPVCGKHEYTHYGRPAATRFESLCGSKSYQVLPQDQGSQLKLDDLAEKLSSLGKVKVNDFMLSFEGDVSFRVFKDGRAIIKNVTKEERAKSIYSEYLGL